MSGIDDLARDLMKLRAADLSVEELVAAASAPLPAVRAVAALHPHTPKDTLLSLVADEEFEVVVSVAHNLRSYRVVTQALLALDDERVRAHVLACSTPNVALFDPVANGDYDDAWHLLRNEELEPRMLSRLFTRALEGEFGVCRDSELLGLLILHPHTPEDIRWQIAEMGQVGLNAFLARSPFTPPEILTLLAEDEDTTVRLLASLNPSLPEEVQADIQAASGLRAGFFRSLMGTGAPYDPQVLPVH